MNRLNPKVDGYLRKNARWREEMAALRAIASDPELTEEMKWGHPCYTLHGKNVVLIHGFKAYCALLFFKGALLKDPEGILIQQTENVQAARQIRFTSARDILKMKAALKRYVREAVEIERSGAKVPMKKTREFPIPAEFQTKLNDNPVLKTAFHSLAPGRQRGYLLHFSSAKQSKTREARIEKCTPRILKGKGMDDE